MRSLLTKPLARVAGLAVLSAALAPCAAAEPAVTGVRLLAVTKDSARLRVTLSEPASVAVSYGLEPGDWTGRSQSASPGDELVLDMPKLSPDRRYFYQLEVDGVPQADVATFVSGRSWVTRRALVLATAAAPADAPAGRELADRLFARESDALVLLSGEGDAEAFRSQHARAMTDRVVVTEPDAPAPEIPISDVLVRWGAEDMTAARDAAGACWGVALSRAPDVPMPAGADVLVVTGAASALVREGESIRVVLAPSSSDHAEIAAASGTLTATLVSAAGRQTESLTRTCKVPAALQAPAEARDPSIDDIEERSLDGEAHDAGCDG